MRSILTSMVLLLLAGAAHADCRNDYSGVQRTPGFDYRSDSWSDLAREPNEFVQAAHNFLYFDPDGAELRYRFTLPGGALRRYAPVSFPGCNELGQCATVTVRPVWIDLGIVTVPVLGGFEIFARIDNLDSARLFRPIDVDALPYTLSQLGKDDKRCRWNNGDLRPSDEPDRRRGNRGDRDDRGDRGDRGDRTDYERRWFDPSDRDRPRCGDTYVDGAGRRTTCR